MGKLRRDRGFAGHQLENRNAGPGGPHTMDPNIQKTGTTGAGQTAEGQTLSSQTNVNQATQDQAAQRGNINRGATQGAGQGNAQEGVSFSGPGTPGTQQQPKQTGYPGSNSS